MNLPSVVTRAEVESKVVAMGTGVESPAVLGIATVVDSVLVTATVAGSEVVTVTVVNSAVVIGTVVGSAVVIGAVVAEGHRGDPTRVELTPGSVENNISPRQQIIHV